MTKPPPHEPRHPLQDNLYYALSDYRMIKRGPVLKSRLPALRRRALELIAQIKGRV
jgi:hypothetical protein